MKTIKIIAVVFIGLLLGSSQLTAQQDQSDDATQALTGLNEEQKQLIERRRNMLRENREAMKASLTEEQLAIMQNQQLTKQERHEALVATFTQEQLQIMENNRIRARELRDEFRNTNTTEQRQEIRTRMRVHNNADTGNEVQEMRREQRRNAMDNGGSGKGPGSDNRNGNNQ